MTLILVSAHEGSKFGEQEGRTYPARDVSPTVGLMPTNAFLSAGFMTIQQHQYQCSDVILSPRDASVPLPSVSVPNANIHRLPATLPALPELLPPGLTVKLYGLRACPPLAEYPSE